jgi:hypothetical protein
MPIRLEVPEDSGWSYSEPDDAVRIDFDAYPILESAGLTIEQAEQDPQRFIRVLEELLGDDADYEVRSPGPHVGPDAGDWVRSFLDVLVTAGGVAAATDYAVRITRKLRTFNPRAYVSKKGIEVLSRQQLRFHGHPENSLLVVVEFIAIPDTSGLTGVPPALAGYAAVFLLDDGRLVTMRWSLDAVLEDYSEGGAPTRTAH